MTLRSGLQITAALLLIVGIAWFDPSRWLSDRPSHGSDAQWSPTVSVLAGDGVFGVRDSDASHSRFSDPFGVAAAGDGSVYVTDAGDAQRVRRISHDGAVSTLAGEAEGFVDGFGLSARFRSPSGIASDAAGVMYIADTGNNAIRRVTAEGLVATIAGDGVAGYRDGIGREARFNGPIGIAVRGGRVIVADTYNDRIRMIEPDGRVRTVAGSGQRGHLDGPSEIAQFDTPCGVAVDANDNIYVADTANGAVRRISPVGVVTTIEPLPNGRLFRPVGIAVSGAGVVYVTEESGRIDEITPGVGARVLAGSRPGFADGPGESARFRALAGIALDGPGRVIVADPRNALVRVVAALASIAHPSSASPWLAPAFDVDAFARTPLLWPLVPVEGPFEIAGTLGELRGGRGTERFHAGIDVRAPEGTSVVAIRNGVVASPIATSEFGTLNESVRIGQIAYVHLRVGRRHRDDVIADERFVPTYDQTGRVVDMRVKRGARFSTGESIGTVNRFNHVHLNVGWPGEEYNPLRFDIPYFEDTVPPTITRNGVRLYREDGSPMTTRKAGRLVVDGRVQVVVDAWDQVNGNETRRRLGLYRLGYQVFDRNGSPAPGFESPRQTIRFDRFAGDDEAARLVYASGSGIPFYGTRSTHFLYAITNTLQDGHASAGTWDTSTLSAGDYVLRILAADIRGNEATMNRDVAVTIVRSVNGVP